MSMEIVYGNCEGGIRNNIRRFPLKVGGTACIVAHNLSRVLTSLIKISVGLKFIKYRSVEDF